MSSSVLSSTYGKRRYYKAGTASAAKRQMKRKPVVAIPRNIRQFCSVLPNRMRCRLSYVAVKQLVTTTGLPAPIAFSGNGVYDPDPTAGGNQPNNFDQIMQLYTSYYVVGSRFRARVVPLASAASNPNAPVAGNTTITVLPYVATSAISPSIGQYQQIGMLANAQTRYTSTDRRHATFNKYCKLGQLYSSAPTDVENTGSAAANPTQQWYWVIYYYATAENASATEIASSTLCVRIDYDIVFFSRRANLD